MVKKKLKAIAHQINQKTQAFFIKRTILVIIWIIILIIIFMMIIKCNHSNYKDLVMNDNILNNEITKIYNNNISNVNNSYLI